MDSKNDSKAVSSEPINDPSKTSSDPKNKAYKGYRCPKCNTPRTDISVNSKYDVPYGSGYNVEATCIYIDKRLPRSFVNSVGKTVDIHKYLVLHEVVEKMLIDHLGLDYNHAHTIAMGAESTALLRDGVNYDEYFAYIGKYVSFDIDPKDINSVPPDLDEIPYLDDGLTDVVKKIRDLKSGKIKPTKDTKSTDGNVEAPNTKTANDLDNNKAF